MQYRVNTGLYIAHQQQLCANTSLEKTVLYIGTDSDIKNIKKSQKVVMLFNSTLLTVKRNFTVFKC